jgi:hypothetical protein
VDEPASIPLRMYGFGLADKHMLVNGNIE